jgi:hypothetical protein
VNQPPVLCLDSFFSSLWERVALFQRDPVVVRDRQDRQFHGSCVSDSTVSMEAHGRIEQEEGKIFFPCLVLSCIALASCNFIFSPPVQDLLGIIRSKR